jgi:hypothetical protein
MPISFWIWNYNFIYGYSCVLGALPGHQAQIQLAPGKRRPPCARPAGQLSLSPVVLKIRNVEPAFTPPHVKTIGSTAGPSSQQETPQGEALDMGDSSSLEVVFEYRPILGEDINSRTSPWTPTPIQTISGPGPSPPRSQALTQKAPTNFAPSFTISWRIGDHNNALENVLCTRGLFRFNAPTLSTLCCQSGPLSWSLSLNRTVSSLSRVALGETA